MCDLARMLCTCVCCGLRKVRTKKFSRGKAVMEQFCMYIYLEPPQSHLPALWSIVKYISVIVTQDNFIAKPAVHSVHNGGKQMLKE